MHFVQYSWKTVLTFIVLHSVIQGEISFRYEMIWNLDTAKHSSLPTRPGKLRTIVDPMNSLANKLSLVALTNHSCHGALAWIADTFLLCKALFCFVLSEFIIFNNSVGCSIVIHENSDTWFVYCATVSCYSIEWKIAEWMLKCKQNQRLHQNYNLKWLWIVVKYVIISTMISTTVFTLQWL